MTVPWCCHYYCNDVLFAAGEWNSHWELVHGRHRHWTPENSAILRIHCRKGDVRSVMIFEKCLISVVGAVLSCWLMIYFYVTLLLMLFSYYVCALIVNLLSRVWRFKLVFCVVLLTRLIGLTILFTGIDLFYCSERRRCPAVNPRTLSAARVAAARLTVSKSVTRPSEAICSDSTIESRR